MKFIFIIYIFYLIIKVYCGTYTTLNEALALLILAAGYEDGNIVQAPVSTIKINGVTQTIRGNMKVNVSNNGNLEASISQIIATLRINNRADWNSLFGNSIGYKSITFNDLHKYALNTLNKYFNPDNQLSFQDNNNFANIRQIGENIIDTQDMFKYLTTSTDKENLSPPIGLFNGNAEELYFISDSNINNIINYFNSLASNQPINLNLNNIQDPDLLNAIRTFITTLSQNDQLLFDTPGTTNSAEFITIAVIKSNAQRYHFFVSNMIKEKMTHVSALIKDNNGNYINDGVYAKKNIDFIDAELRTNNYYKNIDTNFNQRVFDNGIGLIPASGVSITTRTHPSKTPPRDYAHINNNRIEQNSIAYHPV